VRTALVLWIGILASVPDGRAATLSLDGTPSSVSFTLDATAHTVEGSFEIRPGSVTFEPENGTLSGEIVVDLAGGKTGNARRDAKMREEVLETERFPVAVFRPGRLLGRVPAEGTADLEIEGVLLFHGEERELTLPVRITVSGPAISAVSEFSIPYVAWGLEDPSVFVLRVAKEVTVEVRLAGTLAAGPAPATP
jgi:polyisoprenoid-binding protein YceI